MELVKILNLLITELCFIYKIYANSQFSSMDNIKLAKPQLVYQFSTKLNNNY